MTKHLRYTKLRRTIQYCVLHVTQPLVWWGNNQSRQATDMALACCLLGKVLGVGCHYFRPPLEIPTYAAMYLHVCTTRDILVAKGGTMGENIVR